MNLRAINFRPLSNLRFISKIIEKCVAQQLTEYLNNNGPDETFQSTYKSNHSNYSTETAFIRVFCDTSQRKTKLINCVGDINALKCSNKLLIEQK